MPRISSAGAWTGSGAGMAGDAAVIVAAQGIGREWPAIPPNAGPERAERARPEGQTRSAIRAEGAGLRSLVDPAGVRWAGHERARLHGRERGIELRLDVGRDE